MTHEYKITVTNKDKDDEIILLNTTVELHDINRLLSQIAREIRKQKNEMAESESS